MSARPSSLRPRTCSGERYLAVPIITLSLVRSSSPSRPLAMPKSVSRTRPSGVTRMLPGFTSRWTNPAWCAASSAAATHVPMWIVSSGLSRVCTSSSWRRLLPSTSCITTACRPLSSNTSWIATMFGWVSPATATASRRKRSATIGSLARLGLSHFSATRRSSIRSVASHTSAMPPWASRRSS